MHNIIYDATVLTNVFNKCSFRSGIFFVAFNILKELLQRKDVKVSLYIDPEKYAAGKRFRDVFFPGLKMVFRSNNIDWLCRINFCLQMTYFQLYSRFFLRKLIVLPLYLTGRIIKHNVFKELNTDLLKSADVYFSPVFSIPEIVRQYENITPCLVLHDTIAYLFPKSFPSGIPPFLRKIKESGSKNDLFFCVSQCTLNDAKKVFPFVNDENAFVAYLAANGTFRVCKDNDIFRRVCIKYKIPVEKKYVFSLCTLEPRKNLIRALKTFVSFIKRNEINDLVWVLGGSHWETFINKLSREIDDFEEYKNLIVRTGYVDDIDLPVLYSNAEWFVYTSQYEGFGLPPLEAMQCGCPVIVSNKSSLTEVVGDAGILIDWNSDEQHIASYEKYYFDENLRKEYAQKGLERAKFFSWKKMVDEMVNKMKGESLL